MHLPLKDSEKLVRLYITQHLASLISWHLCTACVLRCTAHCVLRVCLCGITVLCVALCVCACVCAASAGCTRAVCVGGCVVGVHGEKLNPHAICIAWRLLLSIF